MNNSHYNQYKAAQNNIRSLFRMALMIHYKSDKLLKEAQKILDKSNYSKTFPAYRLSQLWAYYDAYREIFERDNIRFYYNFQDEMLSTKKGEKFSYWNDKVTCERSVKKDFTNSGDLYYKDTNKPFFIRES